MSITAENKLSATLLAIRLALGIVVLGHGTQKLLGWFGGYGFDGTMGYFTQTIGIPYFLGVLIILVESVGMIGLILGLCGRIISASLIFIMAGAIFFDHWQYGFFMDWGNNLQGEGYEFHLLVISLALAIVINGTGAYSIDRLLRSWLGRKRRVLA